jgi:hypothetical protein
MHARHNPQIAQPNADFQKVGCGLYTAPLYLFAAKSMELGRPKSRAFQNSAMGDEREHEPDCFR